MGTSVLLPRDCLSPRSRHKHQFAEMIYREESAPRVRRSGVQSPQPLRNVAYYAFYSEYAKHIIVPARFVAKERDSGILPLPPHKGSLPINIPEVRNKKSSKRVEKRDARNNAKMLPDDTVITILQRPKNNSTVVAPDAATVHKHKYRTEVQAATLVNKDEGEVLPSSAQGNKDNSIKLRHGDLEKSPTMTRFQKHSKPSLAKQNMKQNEGKISEQMKVSSHDVPQISARSDAVSKQIVKSKANNNIVSANLPPLRRTTTDPEVMSSVLYKCQNKSEACISEMKHVDNCCSMKTLTVASHERWAEPAYSSSPSPSSLPLPKFSRPLSRVPSPGLVVPKDVKEADKLVSASLSVSLPSMSPVSHVETWDVALATKSLKKMLNLDPK